MKSDKETKQSTPNETEGPKFQSPLNKKLEQMKRDLHELMFSSLEIKAVKGEDQGGVAPAYDDEYNQLHQQILSDLQEQQS